VPRLGARRPEGSVDLYLVRHAPAFFQKDHDRWPHDNKRPLTPEGEEALMEWAKAETFEEVRSCWARLGERTTLH
jgi:broad specificity phosphatase PhoE